MTFEEFWNDDLVSDLVTWQQMAYIEQLCLMSTMSADEVFDTLDRVQYMTADQADGMIKLLQLSQKNPEEYGVTNQTMNVESVRARVARDDFYEK